MRKTFTALGSFVLGSLVAASLALVACGPSNQPTPSSGGDEIMCPDGSANPGVSIITVNCSTVVQFDGDEFEAALDVKSLANAGVKNVDVVMREVSQAAKDAQIQFSQTCELFNGCNLTSAEFRRELTVAHAHFRTIREKVALLQASDGNPEVLRKTVEQLYVETVPASRVALATLDLEFSLQARGSSTGAKVVMEGQTLRTGDEVVFGVRTSQSAFVYIFQRKSSGEIEVLFPNSQITTMNNPIPAGQLVRIPPAGQVFTVDDKDLGEETIYIAASKKPLDDLESALAGVGNDSPENREKVGRAMADLFEEGAPECSEQTRGLEVSEESGCGSMTRGLSPTQSRRSDDFFTETSSVQARTAPGDDVLMRAFKFMHAQ